MKVMEKMMPSATDLIRSDHTVVTALFHQYELDASPAKKRALVEKICTEIEIHAAVEEEIFYPAMRGEGQDAALVDKSYPEHGEIKALIARLRESASDGPSYDSLVMELMNHVMHHVADEETKLLADAERRIGDRLGELGGRMMKRKLELKTERTTTAARGFVQQHPFNAIGAGMAAGLVLGVLATGRKSGRRSYFR